MKTRTLSILGLAALVAVPAAAPVASAQEPSGAWVFAQGKGKGLAARAEFVATEMAFDVTPVKGAPYSAEAVTETVQTLGDGNRIVHSSRSTIHRDSEGRTRRENTLGAIGPFAAGAEPEQIVSINDPVAGVHYILSPSQKTARKLPAATVYVETNGKRDVVVKRELEAAAAMAKAGDAADRVVLEPGAKAVRVPLERPRVMVFDNGSTTVAAGVGENFRVELAEPKDARKEDLGTRTIEGVEATGTRTTVTIAAGEIGNERPIEIVSERWYSPELQTVVSSRHSDPRFGETTFKLSNVSRAEPDRALFEPPSDYTVEEIGAPMNMKMKVLRETRTKKSDQ
jgi:hypothetical protein